jgi:hypothetical protein
VSACLSESHRALLPVRDSQCLELIERTFSVYCILVTSKQTRELAVITMSTLAGPGAAEDKNADRRMSLGKYVKRMSSVFKREKSSKSSGLAGPVSPSAVEAEQQTTKEAAGEEVAPAS